VIEIFDISYDEREVIKTLWERNRLHHEKSSEYFKQFYRSLSFDKRFNPWEGLNKDTMKITVAKSHNKYIGYCISTIIDGKGELESLHVNESNRGNGIGEKLVIKHIEWMKEKNCKVIGVAVSQENESTIGFYRKLGFYPKTLFMQLK
jgi:ribosomal protein S18 acetylase RimI-like enzyme